MSDNTPEADDHEEQPEAARLAAHPDTVVRRIGIFGAWDGGGW